MRPAERHENPEIKEQNLMGELGIKIYCSVSEGGDKISRSLEMTGLWRDLHLPHHRDTQPSDEGLFLTS